MGWPKRIVDILGLRETEKVLILDETGVLSSQPFLAYLEKHGLRACVLKDTESLVAGMSRDILVAPPRFPVPGWLRNGYRIVSFSWANLPFAIEKTLHASLSDHDLLLFLEAYDATNAPRALSLKNIEQSRIDARNGLLVRRHAHNLARLREHADEPLSIDLLVKLGQLWGDYLYCCYLLQADVDAGLAKEIDASVSNFILAQGINQIFYTSPEQLYSVHNILDYLATCQEEKIALVCFDGMGWAEWLVIREHLAGVGFHFTERSQCALIPTITAISRAAIFSGCHDAGFKTVRVSDDIAFARYWSAKGFIPAFFRNDDLKSGNDLLGYSRVAVLCNFVDTIAHNTMISENTRSKNLFFQALANYIRAEKIENMFNILKDEHYKIFICSDHGTVMACGNGRKIEKYMIDDGSKRGTIIDSFRASSDILNKEIAYRNPLIQGKIILLAENRSMYGSRKVTAITHGGVSVEELVVPFVEISFYKQDLKNA